VHIPSILGLVVMWLALLAGGWLGWQLLRQNGRILLRLEELEFGEAEEPQGLPVGSEAPAFELPDLARKRRTLAEFRGQPLLLVFFNPACGFCRELLPKLSEKAENRKQRAEMEAESQESGVGVRSERLLVVIVSTGGAEANRQLFKEHQLTCPVLLQKQVEVAAAYKANGTPSGYLINAQGKIASELAMGAEALLALAAGDSEAGPRLPEAATGNNGHGRESRFGNHSLARSKIKRDGLKAGTLAPDFRLPRLDGRGDLGLADLRGRRVLLVFSSPHCGPCLTLAPHLENFHRDHPELEVVMISKGEPTENRAKVKEYGLTFPVVLQQQWEVSRRYAMFATPIAYLIDEAGVITQDVAVGADSVLDLIARAEPLFRDRRAVVVSA
jgi:peroxiredoxin